MAPWIDLVYAPTHEEREAEQEDWTFEDMRSDAADWESQRAEAKWDFRSWPLTDLEDEFEVVQTLTPDQTEVIAELVEEIARRNERVA